MNELMNNFINQIEDINKVKEITVEEFSKLVKANTLITESDAKKLIESFKKISSNNNVEDEANDSDQRKKKYREQQKELNQEAKIDRKEERLEERENGEDSKER